MINDIKYLQNNFSEPACLLIKAAVNIVATECVSVFCVKDILTASTAYLI